MVDRLLKINILGKKNEEIFNNIIKCYIFFTSIIYILFTIAPIRFLIRDTFLYSTQTYLGIIGSFIIILDALSYRKLFSIKNSYYIYAIIIVSIFSSIVYIKYGGIKDNLFIITWFSIFISIFYCSVYNIYDKNFEIILDKILLYSNIIYSLFAFISIITFYLNIGFYLDIDPAIGNSFTRQGFLNNRLFGLFTSINNSALIASILFISNLNKFYSVKKFKKAMILINEVILYTFIVLSNSRSAEVSIIASLVILFLIIIKNKKFKELNLNIFIRYIIKITISILVAASIFFSFKTIKKSSETLANYINSNFNIHDSLGGSFLKNESNISLDGINNDNDISTDRKDTQSISNNRITIWRDYLKSYRNINIIGLSPKNYSEYLQSTRQDLYIVRHIKDNYPNLYNSGEIYHPHSGYLMVYVATGILGVSLLLSFLLNIFIKFLKIYNNFNIINDSTLLNSIMIVVLVLVNILFDQGVFFVSDFVSIIFWISLAIVLKKVDINLLKGENHE